MLGSSGPWLLWDSMPVQSPRPIAIIQVHKHPTRRPSARTIMVHHSQAVIERDSYSLGCFPADLPTGFACQRKGSPIHARTGDWSKAYSATGAEGPLLSEGTGHTVESCR